MCIKEKHNFSKNKLFSSSQQFSAYLLPQIKVQKIKFSVGNFFSKCEQIRIKLRIYSHLLNKSLTENFILCVAVLLLSLARFSSNLVSRITFHQSTLETDQYPVSFAEINFSHYQSIILLSVWLVLNILVILT